MTRRRMWDDVIPGWDNAHKAANEGRATPAQRAVLEAILYLLGRFQRTEDRLFLSQVAHHSGLWDGTDTCPRSAAAAAGRHLQALAEMGAIRYEPSRSRSSGNRVELVADTRAPTRESGGDEEADSRAPARESTEPTRAPARASNGSTRAHQRASQNGDTRDLDARHARTEPPTRAIWGPDTRAGARASEEVSEVLPRSTSEGAGHGASPPPPAGEPLAAQNARANSHPEHGDTDTDDNFELHPILDALYDQLPPARNGDTTPGGIDAVIVFEHLLEHLPVTCHQPLIDEIHRRKLQPRNAYRAAKAIAGDHSYTLPPLPTTKAKP